MENPRISESAREKLEEATVAVFMEQYGQVLDAGINEYMEDSSAEEFPLELDERCRALIQKEYAKVKNKERKKCVLRVLRSAAVIAVVLLSLSSVLFMTVEAFRIPVMNFFIEKTDRYRQLSGEPNENLTEECFNEENPLDGIIPDGFVLTDVSGTLEAGNLIAKYSNANNSTILFVVELSHGNLQIDDEDAIVTECKIAGHDANICLEKNEVCVAWLDENISRVFILCATNVSQNAVMSFAESVASIFDK